MQLGFEFSLQNEGFGVEIGRKGRHDPRPAETHVRQRREHAGPFPSPHPARQPRGR